MLPRHIEQLIDSFDSLPDITKRQAARIVFYLLKEKDERLLDLARLIANLKKETAVCSVCSNIAPKKAQFKVQTLCTICQKAERIQTLIMVLEKISELERIESLKIYNGLYHIIGEIPVKELSRNNPHIKKLMRRIKNLTRKYPKKKIEIILGFSPTREGELRALFLNEIIAPFGLKITKIARGIPSGGEIEYFDKETLKEAFRRRLVFNQRA